MVGEDDESARLLTEIEVAIRENSDHESETKKVSAYLKNNKKLFAATGQSLTKRRQSARARKLVAGNQEAIKDSLREKFFKGPVGAGLRKLICVELNWRQLRNNLTFNRIVALAKLLVLKLSGVYNAIIAQYVFLITQGLLDELCG